MNRRRFLSVSGLAATTALAGCFGYTIESTDDIESRQSRIDELQAHLDSNTSTLSQTRETLNTTEAKLEQTEADLSDAQDTIRTQEATISALKTENSELDTELSELEDEFADIEATREEEQAKTILNAYSYGIGLVNEAYSSYSNGSQDGDARNFSGAALDFQTARAYYDGADRVFALTKQRATAYGFALVNSWCADAERSAEYRSDASANFALAYAYYSDDEYDSGDEYISQGNSNLEKGQQYNVKDLDELERELGYTINIDPSNNNPTQV